MPSKPAYTAQQMIDAIRQAAGIKQKAAEILGCTRQTIENYCKRYVTVEAAYQEQRQILIDMAESKLIGCLRDGEWPAIKWTLATLGKDRGYVERQEIKAEIEVDWREVTIQHIRAGDIGYDGLCREFGRSLADELFEQAGVQRVQSGTTDES